MIVGVHNFHPAVSDAKFKRFLRFPPRRAFEGPLAEAAAWARAWFAARACPWFFARRVKLRDVVETRDGVAVTLPTPWFGADEAIAVAASAGAEVDFESAARWACDEPDKYCFLESYACAVVEELLAEAARRMIEADTTRTVPQQFCPGFPGWPATDTARFLSFVHDGVELPGPLDALSTGALRPKKSKLALLRLAPARQPALA